MVGGELASAREKYSRGVACRSVRTPTKKGVGSAFKLQSVYLLWWFCLAAPRHVAGWHLFRSGFTSSVSEYNTFWTKGELMGHYCVAL